MVLLVEDEPAVRLFAQRVLQDYGYRVLAFADPGVALDAVIGDPGAFDALVTDVVMPTIAARRSPSASRRFGRGCPSCSCPATGGALSRLARQRRSPNPSAHAISPMPLVPCSDGVPDARQPVQPRP